jgi:4-alpha-glucanotransferase
VSASRPGLTELARLFGVETSYEAMNGGRQVADPEALALTLQALGAELGGGNSPRHALKARRAELDALRMQPVHVAWDGELRELRVRLPGDAPTRAAVHLRLESGEVVTQQADAMPAAPRARGGWRPTHRITLSRRLPLGYHEVQVETAGETLETFIVAAPRRAHIDGAAREWGLFFPLYAICSDGSWGIGDFSDLNRLARWAGEQGAGFVSTLPLLAAFLDAPFDPSPYSPASRLFWNELFVDLAAVPGWSPADGDAGSDLRGCRDGRYVDYQRTAAFKRKEMERALAAASSDAGFRDALSAFEASFPRIGEYARFRAVGDRRREGWPVWPDRLRDGDIREGDYAEEDYRYHVFAQWQADRQLGRVAAAREEGAAALYLDMPLGVNPDSFDTWRFRTLFAEGVSAGAPPDPLFTGGQDWGFRPLNPRALRSSRYGYLIEVFRHHLRHARMLRLDHVMSLYRLFWVPQGFSARQGIYVRYAEEELFAILVMESARHNAIVIGEDLGTVPDPVRKAMDRHDVQRMHVVQFEASPDREPPAPMPPANVVASLNTHDMPTFAGFWRGSEIDDQLDLGLIDEAERGAALEQRSQLRQMLSRSVGAGGEVAAGFVRQRLLERLADSPARIVLVTLEDLWLEPEPQNVPGTSDERPNWKRRAARSLEQIIEDAAIRRMLASVDARRRQAQQTRVLANG